ncbi:MAG: glycosyltransferase family 1 protein [Planctomycetes bacterium]|nr:glycosyltransferase family 1 protein [Planctomycetota bacterium]MBI3834388.1 glycosyltransferase family 1 protein [Planctomycetota bacterium]
MMAIGTIGFQREAMLAKLSAGRNYEFLNWASHHLLACPDDSQVRLLTAREYLRLGLITPAREAVNEWNVVDCTSEVEAVRSAIESVSETSFGWDQLADTFEQNFSAMHDTQTAAAIRAHWECRRDSYQLFQDRNRLYHIRTRSSDGDWRWFPFFGHHQAIDDARDWPEGIGELTPGPYLFDGLGSGGYFERVYRKTLNTFLGYGCALYVVEPCAANVAALFYIRNWREFLPDQRILWYLGRDWSERLSRTWRDDSDLPFPRQAFSLNGEATNVSRDAVNSVHREMQHRSDAIERSFNALEAKYAGRSLENWATRFDEALSGRGPGLRIVASVSIHTTFLQHSMRDVKRALEALGHQCVVLTEITDYKSISPLRHHQAITETDADLFFSIDHLRPEFRSIVPAGLPILTWDQDQLPHVITQANLSAIAPNDFLVGCSKARCIDLGVPAEQLLYANVPTCPEQFSGSPSTAEESRQYECDISYVSHASQTGKEFHDQERRNYSDPATRRLLDTLYELLPSAIASSRVPTGSVTSTVLRAACERCGIASLNPEAEHRLRTWYLWRLGDRLFRHEALEWVAQWALRTQGSFRIYGNGWERHPTLSSFAMGPAGNGRELLCIHRGSKINLQLMPAGFIHQRALDGLAAGGFFLTRLVPIDLRGTTLRRAWHRMSELGVQNNDQLHSSKDSQLWSLISEYLGIPNPRDVDLGVQLYSYIQVATEHPHPDELFPQFGDITFDSAGEFEAKAHAFLSSDERRAEIASAMRKIVVDRLSYRAAMDRFLKGMANYLRKTASRDQSAATSTINSTSTTALRGSSLTPTADRA